MFPAQSPNSQNILQQLQSGGATPSTIDFHRTALNAAKRSGANPTSNPENESSDQPAATTTTTTTATVAAEGKATQNTTVDPFTHHDAADAANGLFMLAKGGQGNAGQFGANPSSIPAQESVEGANGGANGTPANGNEITGDMSDAHIETRSKPGPKGKSKKNAGGAKGAAGKRKVAAAEENATVTRSKKVKASNDYPALAEPISEPGETEDESPKRSHGDSKRMTDEEKRKNFLERNRYVRTLFFFLMLFLFALTVARTGSPLLNVASERSSGSLICKRRSTYSRRRMMLSPRPLHNSARKSSISRLSSWRTRIVPYRKLRVWVR